MDKKVSIVVAIIILLAGMVGLYYYFGNQKNTTNTNTTNTQNFPSGRPEGQENPTGNNNQNQNTNNNQTTNTETPTITTEEALKQIYNKPTAGFGLMTTASTSIVRLTDRSLGQTIETTVTGEDQKKITITTVPKVYESAWSAKGDYSILRYLKEDSVIQTFLGQIKTGTSTGSDEMKGVFLPNQVAQATFDPTGTKIFYLAPSTDGVTGYIADTSLNNKKQIFTSASTEWIASWPKSDTISLTTKASAYANGYTFSLNPQTNTFTQLFGNIGGLTVNTNSEGIKFLYSESTDTGLNFFFYDAKKKVVKNFTLKTLPEKCVWSKKEVSVAYCAVPSELKVNDYPDAWYQGTVSFIDQIWKINTETDENNLLYETINKGGLDVMNPALDKDEKYLVFINKKDLTLWSLKLK
ncbi:MAG: hypothetical protein WCF94_01425 [bacterium]